MRPVCGLKFPVRKQLRDHARAIDTSECFGKYPAVAPRWPYTRMLNLALALPTWGAREGLGSVRRTWLGVREKV